MKERIKTFVSKNVLFTADNHLGHARIIPIFGRPFGSISEMDSKIIENINIVADEETTTFFLGDFCSGNPERYLRLIPGQKILIRGNHDDERYCSTDYGWDEVHSLLEIYVDGVFIVLCHYGMRVWNKSHHGALHFYGHSHGALPGNSQSMDVGVDVWNYRPARLTDIRQRLSTLPHRPRFGEEINKENP